MDSGRISSFSLIIKRKDTSLMFRMTSLSFVSSVIIRFHQTCHIPIEFITTGEISFELNAIRKNGEMAVVGAANCLTSVVENHAMKILQLLNDDKVCIGKLSVTLSYQRTFCTMDDEDRNMKCILQNRILSQREYNFLLSRRFHRPRDRPSSWSKEYEEYLNLDPGLILKDIHASVINPIHRICMPPDGVGERPGEKIEDPIGKAFDRKVRTTQMGVGYMGVNWPDKKLF
jgi:hypothetical protein